jgi:hypothetical protein
MHAPAELIAESVRMHGSDVRRSSSTFGTPIASDKESYTYDALGGILM